MYLKGRYPPEWRENGIQIDIYEGTGNIDNRLLLKISQSIWFPACRTAANRKLSDNTVNDEITMQ